MSKLKLDSIKGLLKTRTEAFGKMRDLDRALTEVIREECRRTSQVDVSARIGITQSYLCDILKGRKPINDQIWERLERSKFEVGHD